MLAMLSGRAALAREQSARCGDLARKARTAGERRAYMLLEVEWFQLARQFELAERVSGCLEWSAGRVA